MRISGVGPFGAKAPTFHWRGGVRCCAAFALALSLPFIASAQTVDEEDVEGVRVGTILLRPSLGLRATYDDNIFREETGRDASVILSTRAGVTAETDWRRHSIELGATVESGVFTDSPDDDYLDAKVSGIGILDITRAARLRLRAGAERGHEARGGDDTPTTLAEPVETRRVYADLTGQYARSQFRVQPFVGVNRTDFVDERLIGGGVADQDDRDRVVINGGLKVGFRPPGAVEYFVEGEARWTDFDAPLDRGGVDRDNSELRAVVGATFTPRGPISGSVSVGWRRKRYDDPALNDFSGLALQATAKWEPSQLITLEALARRSVEETTIVGASAADVTYGQVTATYEVRRFVDVVADASFERRRFRGAGRRDETVSLGIGVDWRVRRDATITARYRRIDEHSDAPGEDARVNLLWLGAEYRF